MIWFMLLKQILDDCDMVYYVGSDTFLLLLTFIGLKMTRDKGSYSVSPTCKKVGGQPLIPRWQPQTKNVITQCVRKAPVNRTNVLFPTFKSACRTELLDWTFGVT